MADKTTELKPCPFCGEIPSYRKGNEHDFIGGWSNDVILECCSIEMSVGFGGTDYSTHADRDTLEEEAKIELYKRWNKRI